jgi:hypothetical protein
MIGKCYKRHWAAEFLDFLKQIDAALPKGPDVHLGMDNYATLAKLLHAYVRKLDQPGRTLIRGTDP